MTQYFKELDSVINLKSFNEPLLDTFYLDFVESKGVEYPIVGLTIGCPDKTAPTLGIFAGVHGLERIGTHVCLSFLQGVLTRLQWDKEFRKTFESFRIVSIPLVNPGGMANFSRCNPEGVDLMRNAPLEGNAASYNIISGHRLGAWLPWYRGPIDKEMQLESKALLKFVNSEMFQSSVSVALDIHSGFGMKDRLWFPYAKDQSEFPFKKQVYAIKELLDRTYPHHIYTIEPQHLSYLINGDLWDYSFMQFMENRKAGQIYIPWTLEIGSWIWIKKDPTQIFSALGLFNPKKGHRYRRTMRRHLLLLDFLAQIVKNGEAWFTTKEGGL